MPPSRKRKQPMTPSQDEVPAKLPAVAAPEQDKPQLADCKRADAERKSPSFQHHTGSKDEMRNREPLGKLTVAMIRPKETDLSVDAWFKRLSMAIAAKDDKIPSKFDYEIKKFGDEPSAAVLVDLHLCRVGKNPAAKAWVADDKVNTCLHFDTLHRASSTGSYIRISLNARPFDLCLQKKVCALSPLFLLCPLP